MLDRMYHPGAPEEVIFEKRPEGDEGDDSGKREGSGSGAHRGLGYV